MRNQKNEGFQILLTRRVYILYIYIYIYTKLSRKNTDILTKISSF